MYVCMSSEQNESPNYYLINLIDYWTPLSYAFDDFKRVLELINYDLALFCFIINYALLINDKNEESMAHLLWLICDVKIEILTKKVGPANSLMKFTNNTWKYKTILILNQVVWFAEIKVKQGQQVVHFCWHKLCIILPKTRNSIKQVY